MNRHLIVMAKAPRLGRVKTRLAHDIGAVPAWRFYRDTMSRVLSPLVRDRRWTTWLAVAPDTALYDDAIWPAACPRLPQGGGDLGQRMARMFRSVPPGPAVMIGTDIPGIRPSHVCQAFRSLGAADAVFGPATDGGYWMVGLRRRPRFVDIFQGVRWSTAHALADTLANLPADWRVDHGATLTDVDDGPSHAEHLLEVRKIGAMNSR